jgi:hypothetical protein
MLKNTRACQGTGAEPIIAPSLSPDGSTNLVFSCWSLVSTVQFATASCQYKTMTGEDMQMCQFCLITEVSYIAVYYLHGQYCC